MSHASLVIDGQEILADVPELHPETVQLIDRFAEALKAKLLAAQVKYGYSDGWQSPHWMDECRVKLIEHISKGDPRDVAAYCAFLWYHNERTVLPELSKLLPRRLPR